MEKTARQPETTRCSGHGDEAPGMTPPRVGTIMNQVKKDKCHLKCGLRFLVAGAANPSHGPDSGDANRPRVSIRTGKPRNLCLLPTSRLSALASGCTNGRLVINGRPWSTAARRMVKGSTESQRCTDGTRHRIATGDASQALRSRASKITNAPARPTETDLCLVSTPSAEPTPLASHSSA